MAYDATDIDIRFISLVERNGHDYKNALKILPSHKILIFKKKFSATKGQSYWFNMVNKTLSKSN